LSSGGGEPSAVVAARVAAARERSIDRIGMLTAHIPAAQLDRFAPLDLAARTTLRDELEADRLTGRGYHRVRRVARTFADLHDGGELVTADHVAMALQLRVQLRVSSRGFAA
ncbi:MAG: hypothetical protein RJA49_3048, partial [Actinomycetota bacterium]